MLSVALVLFSNAFSLPVAALEPAALSSARTDEADEQYQFIAGLCEQRHFELAIKEATNFLKQHPRHVKAPFARYRLASALFELDRPQDARAHYEVLVQTTGFEYSAEAALRLGQCELLSERYPEARTALTKALASDQSYLVPIADFFMGEALFHLEDYGAAAAHYQKSLASKEAASYHEHALRGLAWCHYRAKDFKASAEAAARFLRKTPEHALANEVRFLQGDAHFELGQLTEAEAAWKPIEAGEYALAALRGRAYLRSRQGDDRGAATFFARLLDADPAGAFAREAAVQCGAHLLRSGAAKDALLVLQHPAAGQDAETLYWRARAQSATGAKEEALATLNRADKTAQGELKTRIATARGDVLFDLGRLEESAASYGPDVSDYALHAAATAQLNASKFEAALATCAQFFSEYSASPYALSTRGVQAEALFQLGRHAQALPLFQQLAASGTTATSASKEIPTSEERARVALRSGWCHYYLGDLNAAIPAFAQVAQAFKGTQSAGEARYMQGRCEFETGDEQGAATTWSAYLSEHPSGAFATQTRLQLARIEGGTARLEELLRADPTGELAPVAMFELAEQLAAAGDHASAIPRYQEFLQRFPQDVASPRARYGLAWAMREVGNSQDALTQLATLLATPPANELETAALELSVWCAQDVDDAQLAVETWQRLLKQCKDESRVTSAALAVVQTLKRSQRADVAETLVRELRKQLKDPALRLDLLVEEIWICHEQKRLDSAEAGTREALALSPKDSRVLEAAFFVGEARYAMNSGAQAVPFYAAAAQPENGALFDDSLYKLGFALLGADAFDEAAHAFERLLTEQPRSELCGESLFLAGECRFRAGDAKACIAHLSRLRKEFAQHEVLPKALFRLGIAARQCGEQATADSAFTELLKKYKDFPQRSEALLEQGRALAQLDKPRAARAAFDAVLAESSKAGTASVFAARARIEIGRQLFEAGDHDEALSQFLKVSLLYAKSDEVYEAEWLAGNCLEARGERDLAIQQYRKLVEAAPESHPGKAARERLKTLDA